jgi:micrococcal nuclease
MGRIRHLPLVLFLAVAALAACVPQDPPAPEPVPAPASPKPVATKPACRVVSLIDGDTLQLACDGRGTQIVRLEGVDAPEVDNAACDRERAAGLQARAVLARLVASGPVTTARFTGAENAGRALIRLDFAGRNAADAMIEAGVAVPFDGVTYPDWCAQP